MVCFTYAKLQKVCHLLFRCETKKCFLSWFSSQKTTGAQLHSPFLQTAVYIKKQKGGPAIGAFSQKSLTLQP